MPIVSCKLCKKEFYTKPNWLRIGRGKYCSNLCRTNATRRGKKVKCSNCENIVYKTLKSLNNSKSGKYFCGRACSLAWLNGPRNGKKHHRWNKGVASYRGILEKSGVLPICLRCGKTDKRILVVHHKNQDRKNNELDNLIWLCMNCHFLVHHYKVERNGLKMK